MRASDGTRPVIDERAPAGARAGHSRHILDPVSRSSEVLFGLIMVRSDAVVVYVFFGNQKLSSGSLLIPNSPYFLRLFLCEPDRPCDSSAALRLPPVKARLARPRSQTSKASISRAVPPILTGTGSARMPATSTASGSRFRGRPFGSPDCPFLNRLCSCGPLCRELKRHDTVKL